MKKKRGMMEVNNKHHYIVVTGIIIKDGKFLITKRSEKEKAFPGLWTVPGGKLETEDYINKKQDTSAGQWYNVVEDLLRREVSEETGLKVKNIRYLTSLVFVRPDNVPTVVLSLFADYDSGEVCLNGECVDYKWVDLNEAKDYQMIDGIYEELEMVDKILKGEKIGEWGESNIVEKARKFAKEECEKPNANYPTAYQFHFISMHKTAKELAEEMNADIEIVEVAAWMHDIGSIIYGREDHHITGAKIAEEKLKEWGCSKEKIDKIKKCILNHRGSKEDENNRVSLEAKIIAEADVLDCFDNIAKQFLVTLVHEKKPLEEAKTSIVNKLKNKWNQLEFESSRKKIKDKFDAAMLLLK